ncbi:MAG: hypothetical protein WB239_01365 [Acidimicrobiia bacterium]
MLGLDATARVLFRTALAIFVVTIVIGILNGMDVWNPSHEALLTHVHSGTLGWITLSVVGSAFLMLGQGVSEDEERSARRIGIITAAVVGLYVIAFLAGTGIYRPITGTLMLLAIVWVISWVWARYRTSSRTVSQLAILLATISLGIGAVLGVLLGLFIAQGSLPGLSNETASSLAGAHPPAMLIGYLILAGVAVTEWLLEGPEGRSGRIVAWSLFGSGILINISFIFEIDALVQIASALEVVAVVMFIVRMWSRLKPASWGTGDGQDFARMSVVFLAVGIGLLVYLVQLFVSGQLDPETGEGPVGVLLAFDHTMFIGVMTNALFAVAQRLSGVRANPAVLWGVNGGLVIFLVGLVADSALLKRIGAPIMGAALLFAVYWFFRQLMVRRPLAPA